VADRIWCRTTPSRRSRFLRTARRTAVARSPGAGASKRRLQNWCNRSLHWLTQWPVRTIRQLSGRPTILMPFAHRRWRRTQAAILDSGCNVVSELPFVDHLNRRRLQSKAADFAHHLRGSPRERTSVLWDRRRQFSARAITAAYRSVTRQRPTGSTYAHQRSSVPADHEYVCHITDDRVCAGGSDVECQDAGNSIWSRLRPLCLRRRLCSEYRCLVRTASSIISYEFHADSSPCHGLRKRRIRFADSG
jgi:hypothetical protein